MSFQQTLQLNAPVKVTLRWSDFKSIAAAKAMPLQYAELGDSYQVFALDGNAIVYLCQLIKTGTSPSYQWSLEPDYSQAQNDIDVADFTNNWQVSCNKPVDAYFTPVSGSKSSAGLVNFYGAYLSSVSTSQTALNGTTYTEPTTAASRSFASSAATDTPGNTGAYTLQLCYYDNNMNGPFFETITLNGTSNVNTVGGNIRFVEWIKVMTAGANGGNNGTITMFGATNGGGGTVTTIAAGDGQTYFSHHYVRPNKTFYLKEVFAHCSSSNGTAGGSLSVKNINPFVSSSVEFAIGSLFRVPNGQPMHFEFGDDMQVQGPARVRFTTKADSSIPISFFLNYGWEEY